jgi:hypothetical protein
MRATPQPFVSLLFQISSQTRIALAAIVASLSPPPIVVCIVSRSSNGGGTDLEDIGHRDGVLGGLALGGDDGDGWPRHGGCCVLTWWLVVAKKRLLTFEFFGLA